jgi:rRNA maturation endonuclease Nob1
MKGLSGRIERRRGVKYQCHKCKHIWDFGNEQPYLWCPSCSGEAPDEEIELDLYIDEESRLDFHGR